MKDYADKRNYINTPTGLIVVFIVLAYSIVSWIDSGVL